MRTQAFSSINIKKRSPIEFFLQSGFTISFSRLAPKQFSINRDFDSNSKRATRNAHKAKSISKLDENLRVRRKGVDDILKDAVSWGAADFHLRGAQQQIFDFGRRDEIEGILALQGAAAVVVVVTTLEGEEGGGRVGSDGGAVEAMLATADDDGVLEQGEAASAVAHSVVRVRTRKDGVVGGRRHFRGGGFRGVREAGGGGQGNHF